VRPEPTVVVTGLGAVTALGGSARSTWRGLRAGHTAIAPFSRFDAARFRTKLAGEADVPAGGFERRAERLAVADRFALAAAREALAQSELDTGAHRDRLGVYFGSSTGGMWEGESFFERALGSNFRQVHVDLLAQQQYNAPGDAVARRLGARGPVETVSAACASGSMALGMALHALRRGDCDVAIAGAADSLCRITYGGFNALRSVDPAPCAPFRARRQGLSIGEGSGVVVLERRDDALARGARPLAELCGAGWSCDAHHMTAPAPDGAGAARALRSALADAGIGAEALDFVNAHGTGTPLNDAAEARALREVLGDRASSVPVVSTKALLGHLLGAAGAVEAVVTILCLAEREIHPMPAAGEVDPEVDLDLVIGSPRPLAHARFAASLNLAFGGANAAVVLARADARD
jgi:3-oxoacyl-[acyl-carrier-protein] synthase II